ncbi:DUF4214 domain-containing protein [Pseudomonas oryzihabitans]|uniref:DUF4214 domain-containing protein n=1 Tax=Pseudomonas oryzihabitans TaxID=47885 RepID=UPI002896456A|nr:DUF4214 domain-containing protein [Pseudomonas oryzihabitans]
MAVTSAQIQQLYVGYFGRPADQAGLNYWLAASNAANSTVTLDSIRASFAEQNEYLSTYGNLSREATVTQIYQNLFGRTASADEVGYWTYTSANTPKENLIQAFLEAASTSDRAVVDAKAAFADQLTGVYGTTATGSDFADLKKTFTDAVDKAKAEQAGPNPPSAAASYQAAFDAATKSLGFDAAAGTFNAFGNTSATVTFPATQTTALPTLNVDGSKLADLTVVHAFGDNTASDLAVDFSGAANLTSLKLNLTSTSTDDSKDNVTLTLTGPTEAPANGATPAVVNKLATLDASSSNVDITFVATNAAASKLTNITLGSGTDDVTIATGTYTAADTKAGTAAVQAKAIALATGDGADIIKATVNDANVQINAGAGDDKVTLTFGDKSVAAAGNHGAEIALGAGKDALTVTGFNVQFYEGSDAAKAAQLSAATTKVLDFAAGDTITLTGATYKDLGTFASNDLKDFNAATTLVGKLDAMAVLLNATDGKEAVHFEFGGNTYVFADNAATKVDAPAFGAGDTLIELTGATGLASTSFVAA